MAGLRTSGKVVECHPSSVKAGRFYVTVETAGWGIVKYVSTMEKKVGDEVVLVDQKCRCMTDPIMWREVRK